MVKIFKKIGFKEISCIKKKRESWLYKDFRFDCDKVKNLGFFVEVEFKGKIDNLQRGRKKIFNFLKKIGLQNWKVIKRGYPWMMWNKGKNYFEDL